MFSDETLGRISNPGLGHHLLAWFAYQIQRPVVTSPSRKETTIGNLVSTAGRGGVDWMTRWQAVKRLFKGFFSSFLGGRKM